MQPLYTTEEFEAAKSRQLLPLQCLYCRRTFYKTKHHIQDFLRSNTKDTGEFCCHKCHKQYENPPVEIHCDQCGKSFHKKPCDIKRTKHNFCSGSCATKWTNTHKKHGTRISKLEFWFQTQLPIIYPSLEFHFNRKDAINGELDIFIPSLKLAFELNGIFHYEPIYGPEKLASIQTNDHRKSQACLERGIELCIIDSSSMKNFKEHRAMIFLQIIQNIINSKLSRSSPAFAVA